MVEMYSPASSSTSSLSFSGEPKEQQRIQLGIDVEEKNCTLRDLHGVTAARAKSMTPEERDLVLLKRKLRNRESARRSNMRKQQKVEVLDSVFKHQLKDVERIFKLYEQTEKEIEKLEASNIFRS